MRKPLSILVALIPFSLVAYLVVQGLVVLPEYWTQLAVALTMVAIGVVYWGWKPEIHKAIAERKPLGIPTLAPKRLREIGEKIRTVGISEMGHAHGQFKLATYKELYDFASSIWGMHLLPSDARKWVEDWQKHYSDKDFETFKEYYRYASSIDGLHLLPSEARKWALDKLLRSL